MGKVPLLERILLLTLSETHSSSTRLESETGLAVSPDQQIVLVNPLGVFITRTEDHFVLLAVLLLGPGDAEIIPQYLPVSPVEPVLAEKHYDESGPGWGGRLTWLPPVM